MGKTPIIGKTNQAIDNMRGFAIIMVIIVHTAQMIPGLPYALNLICRYCQMGVQMFFIASAITLCNSFSARKNETHNIFKFYVRRFFRIAPGYYAGIVAFYIFGMITDSIMMSIFGRENILSLTRNPVSILMNLLLLNGLSPSGNNNVVPGGWSIGTEVLFYIMFPLIYMMYERVQKNMLVLIIIPLVAESLMITATFALFPSIISSGHYNNSFMYFSIFTQMPVFLCGMSFYFLFIGDFFSQKLFPMVVTGTSMIIFGLYIFSGNDNRLYVIAPFISAIAFLIVFLVFSLIRTEIKVLRNIGINSYAIYLCHTLFAYYLTSAIVYFSASFSMNAVSTPVLLLILSVSLSIFLSYKMSKLIYSLIEKPGIRLGKSTLDRIFSEKGKSILE